MADEEKQEPELPQKKEKKNSGGMSKMLMMGGIGLGVLIINAVLIIVVAKYVLPQPVQVAQVAGQEQTENADKKVKKRKKPKTEEEEYFEELKQEEEEEAMQGGKNIKFTETGRITTNPKGSTALLVMNLGMEVRTKPHDPDDEEEVEEEGKEKPVMDKTTLAKLKGIIIYQIGNMTTAELQNRGELLKTIKNKLKPLFKKHKMFLKDVFFVEYLIQE